jgi:hypothetical protein
MVGENTNIFSIGRRIGFQEIKTVKVSLLRSLSESLPVRVEADSKKDASVLCSKQ